MFGYVYINKPELKVREFEKYRSYYCGLCRSLKEGYGLKGAMTLNYDMTFLMMLLQSLYEPEVRLETRRCIAHPFMVHEERTSSISFYAADMNILLAYYNLKDDWEDDRKLSRGGMGLLLKQSAMRIEKQYPRQVGAVRKGLEGISELEKAKVEDIELPACEFGRILGELFLYDDKDPLKESVRQCGFYLGKFVYILDAYDDILDDLKSGAYNGLRSIYGQPDFDQRVEEMLRLNLSRCAQEMERLPLIEDLEIMRNILYAGCWVKFDEIKEKRIDGSV